MKADNIKSSVKRFGPRYGSTVKSKVAKLEAMYQGKHKCPYCNYVQVKRISAGIWACNKCGAKFAGRAYNLGGKAEIAESKKEFEEFEDTEEEQAEENIDEESAEEETQEPVVSEEESN